MELTKKKNKRRTGAKKGTPFERELARQLSTWWTQDLLTGPDDNCIWRTSQSGGRSTTRAKVGKSSRVHCSDLCAIHPCAEDLFKFMVIECKKGYSKDTLHDLLDDPKKLLPNGKESIPIYRQWLNKVEVDRQRAGALHWCIIHMRDRREPLIVAPLNLFRAVEQYGGNMGNLEYRFPACRLVLPVGEANEFLVLIVEPLKRFLQAVKPKQIRAVLAQQEGNNGKSAV